MAADLLVHGPAADMTTVAGIFEARGVETNRRGAALNDDEAVAFLCGRG